MNVSPTLLIRIGIGFFVILCIVAVGINYQHSNESPEFHSVPLTLELYANGNNSYEYSISFFNGVSSDISGTISPGWTTPSRHIVVEKANIHWYGDDVSKPIKFVVQSKWSSIGIWHESKAVMEFTVVEGKPNSTIIWLDYLN